MKRTTKISLAVAALPAIAIGWWLGSPLFLNQTVDEDFPAVAASTVTTTTTTVPAPEANPQERAATDAAGEDRVESTPDPEPATGPVPRLIGAFRDADQAHRGTGAATVYELEDGSRVLRFEEFEVTNGPALRVYLVPHDDPTSRDDVTGYLDLGELKGNVGNQNYEIPDDVDLSQYGSVVIYCEPFHVIFSVASLTDAQEPVTRGHG